VPEQILRCWGVLEQPLDPQSGSALVSCSAHHAWHPAPPVIVSDDHTSTTHLTHRHEGFSTINTLTGLGNGAASFSCLRLVRVRLVVSAWVLHAVDNIVSTARPSERTTIKSNNLCGCLILDSRSAFRHQPLSSPNLQKR
jgi:hypothetical protein